jgi:hypothetical protein
MPHYKDIEGKVHYLDDAHFVYLLPEGCVEITKEEANQLQASIVEITQPDPTLLRSQAYREESDPLFFKAQRGEATMDEWLAKIKEIKDRYPK